MRTTYVAEGGTWTRGYGVQSYLGSLELLAVCVPVAHRVGCRVVV